jgi:hypothetical protein
MHHSAAWLPTGTPMLVELTHMVTAIMFVHHKPHNTSVAGLRPCLTQHQQLLRIDVRG